MNITAPFHHFETRSLERSVDASFIALIPKKGRATQLKDFRPSSLVGFRVLLMKGRGSGLQIEEWGPTCYLLLRYTESLDTWSWGHSCMSVQNWLQVITENMDHMVGFTHILCLPDDSPVSTKA